MHVSSHVRVRVRYLIIFFIIICHGSMGLVHFFFIEYIHFAFFFRVNPTDAEVIRFPYMLHTYKHRYKLLLGLLGSYFHPSYYCRHTDSYACTHVFIHSDRLTHRQALMQAKPVITYTSSFSYIFIHEYLNFNIRWLATHRPTAILLTLWFAALVVILFFYFCLRFPIFRN